LTLVVGGARAYPRRFSDTFEAIYREYVKQCWNRGMWPMSRADLSVLADAIAESFEESTAL
jgi:hypothetical protein